MYLCHFLALSYSGLPSREALLFKQWEMLCMTASECLSFPMFKGLTWLPLSSTLRARAKRLELFRAANHEHIDSSQNQPHTKLLVIQQTSRPSDYLFLWLSLRTRPRWAFHFSKILLLGCRCRSPPLASSLFFQTLLDYCHGDWVGSVPVHCKSPSRASVPWAALID